VLVPVRFAPKLPISTLPPHGAGGADVHFFM
jgi:hypothetical protein